MSVPNGFRALILAAAIVTVVNAAAQEERNAFFLQPARTDADKAFTVGKQADADWFISPVSVPAARDFDLRILNDKYGNCQTTFSHVGHTVQDGRILRVLDLKAEAGGQSARARAEPGSLPTGLLLLRLRGAEGDGFFTILSQP